MISTRLVHKLFIFFLQITLIITLTSCTSSSSKMEDEMSEEEEYVDEDEEDGEEEYVDEEYVDEDNEESTESDEIESFVDQIEGEEGIEDAIPSPIADTETPVDMSAPKRTWVPVKKVPTSSWKKSGKWINSVYIARSGDTLDSISSKIYGQADSAVELRDWNPHFKHREPKVGDKIYYNSPKRPNDNSQFLNYYEDNGEAPMSHDIQSGENIRAVSEKLLGHPDSWKEIWATNFNIESKGVIDQTTTIQYWIGKKDYVIPEAEQPAALEEEKPEEASPMEDSTGMEEEDDPFMDPSEPSSETEKAEENIFTGPEPELTPPPKTPPTQHKMQTPDVSSGSDNSKFKIALIAVIVVVLGLIVARLVRKRKERAEFDFTAANIDIDNIEE